MPNAFLLVRNAGMPRFTTSLAIRRHVLQNTAATVTCTERGILRKSALPKQHQVRLQLEIHKYMKRQEYSWHQLEKEMHIRSGICVSCSMTDNPAL